MMKKNNVTVINNANTNKTMIFAHGFGTDQTAWEKVSDAFKDEYRLVLYDNVGAGKADPDAFSPNKYNTLDAYANDLLDICNELNITDAILVGHSVSGIISVLAAIKEPHHFSKLILVGASARYRNDEGYIGGFNQEALDGLYEAMASNYFAWVSGFSKLAMSNPDRPHLAEYFSKSLGAIRPDIAQSVSRVIFQSDYRHVLPKLDKETLLIQTKEDVAVPLEAAQYLEQHIKNSQLVVIEAQGHFPHISAPDEVINAIKKFI